MGEEPVKSVFDILVEEADKLLENQQNRRLSHEDFLEVIKEELSEDHFFAVIVSNMIADVKHSGWYEWYRSKHHHDKDDLVDFFSKDYFENFKETQEIIGILEEVEEVTDWFEGGESEVNQISPEYRDVLQDVCMNALQEDFEYQLRTSERTFERIINDLEEIINGYFERDLLTEKNGEDDKIAPSP